MPFWQREPDSKVKGLLKEKKWNEIVSLAQKDKEVVNELIQLLGDSKAEVRQNAAWALGFIAGEDAEVVKPAVPRLIELVVKPAPSPIELLQGYEVDWGVRSAAKALRNIAEKDTSIVKPAVFRLIELLKDSQAGVRVRTAWAVGNIALEDVEMVKPAVSRLIELLKDSQAEVRGNAAGALGSIALQDAEVVKPAVPRLIELLQDYEEKVLGNVAGALGCIALEDAAVVKPAVPRLIELLKDSSAGARGYAAMALGYIAQQDAEVVKPAVPRLIELLKDSQAGVRGNAAMALGRIAREDAEVVKPAVPRLIELFKDSKVGVRRNAAWAVGRIGDIAALLELRILTTDSADTALSQEGRWIKTTVGEVAREAIKKIRTVGKEKAEAILQGKQEEKVQVSPFLQRKPPPNLITTRLLDDYCQLTDASSYACGGFADIFRATEKESGELVAVKMPRVRRQEGEILTMELKTINEFLQEADKWSRLKHLHILVVKAWGDKPLPWIAMEFAPEGSLRKRLLTGKLPPKEARDIAIKLCLALQYAHSRGVAHLDIKPENVLFVHGEPKLSDWGTAKTLLYESVTRSKFTPEYAAPEQLDPRYGEPDHQTDIYQLGAMLSEMVSSKVPFSSQIPAVLLQEILEKVPERLSQKDPEVPPALDEILSRALAKRKEERYEATLEMRKDLEKMV